MVNFNIFESHLMTEKKEKMTIAKINYCLIINKICLDLKKKIRN